MDDGEQTDLEIIEDMMADYGLSPDDTLADLLEAARESETEAEPQE